MSTSPEPVRPAHAEGEIVSALSHWLAYHLGNAELRARLRELGTDCLDPEQAEMVDEVLAELEQAPEGERGELEMLVRETLEAIALG
jgi:(p)ppGpp synthase/HD superfamily hydrolase